MLVVNVLWFGYAFYSFGVRARRTVGMLVRKESRGELSYEALVGSLRFLGGMNLGAAVLSLASLMHAEAGGRPLVFFASMVAHASQLAFNVPFALRGGRTGGAPWDVLSGPMAFVFAMDAACTIANGVALCASW